MRTTSPLQATNRPTPLPKRHAESVRPAPRPLLGHRIARRARLGPFAKWGALALLIGSLQSIASAQIKYDEESPLVNFEVEAKAFLELHQLSEKTREAIEVEELIQSSTIHIQLGLYDLHYPIDALDNHERLADFQSVATYLLGVQSTFLDWVEPTGPDQDSMRDDLKVLTKWFKSWRLTRLRDVDKGEERDLAVLLKPKNNQAEALQRFATAMRLGQPLGLDRKTPVRSRLILMPTRRHFIQFVSFAGWLHESLRHVFWHEDLSNWLGCRVYKDQIVAMEFRDTKAKDSYIDGVSMNKRRKLVMEQNAAHFATQALFDNYYGDLIPAYLTTGIVMNMVINVFGEVDTRMEGDLRARYTDAVSVFVPGGAPGGGSLPAIPADTRWRVEHGAGHFIKILHDAQEDGADAVKRSKSKLLHFELEGDDSLGRTPVTAPFLGAPAVGKPLPEEKFLGDYREFYRSYKACFTWWIQSGAKGSKKNSAKTFSQFLTSASGWRIGDFEKEFIALYDGHPISSHTPDDETLEGRFLAWLAKQ